MNKVKVIVHEITGRKKYDYVPLYIRTICITKFIIFSNLKNETFQRLSYMCIKEPSFRAKSLGTE